MGSFVGADCSIVLYQVPVQHLLGDCLLVRTASSAMNTGLAGNSAAVEPKSRQASQKNG